jgi:VanZ family protein
MSKITKSNRLAKEKTEKSVSENPLMKQYNQIKESHPQALLLFRVGDFYETFGSDAIITSKILGIILTKRGNGTASEIELAGFPYHSLDTYLPKLVRAGQRVAICEQLEDPKMTKTIVKRGVTELLTPGVSFNDQVLEQKKNNFLCAIHSSKDHYGISFLDVSTGEFLTAEGNKEHIDKLIHALGYGVLAVLACGLFAPGKLRTAAVLWLMVFGGLIELAQGAWAINRLADPWDLLANTCGIMAAVLLFRRRNVLQYIEKWLRK